jgi:hypothetical protein
MPGRSDKAFWTMTINGERINGSIKPFDSYAWRSRGIKAFIGTLIPIDYLKIGNQKVLRLDAMRMI